MHTRAKDGIFKPKNIMNVHATQSASPIPTSYRSALKDPHWYNAMLEEFNALIKNKTWCPVHKPAGVNVVSGKWIFRHKYNADGTFAGYMGRWVVRGFSQQPGVDYRETFLPVIKLAMIRTVLSIAVTEEWPIHQLDVRKQLFSSW